ncbi:MAG TPA: hypothetical protein VHR66_25380 [Gemmataceae bacterium]|jgi:protein tyrosine phosphatase (PTP) superfamily phosphohydrolase (DUF442 family)|nr:hypothetical protein [Gemmataceae bacterium]
MYRRALILTLALGFALSAGCRNGICHRNPPPPACPPPGTTSIPPVGIPVGPPPPAPVPRGSIPDPGPSSSELLLPGTEPPSKSKSEYAPANPSRGAVLREPDYFETPKPSKPAEPESKAANNADRPTGIVDFTRVKDGVYTGQRPDLDGLDWLKAKGYKTIVHVKRPQDMDDTDRGQVEKRDMKFISLPITPEMLTNEWIDEFNRIVGDTSARSVFVYGQDPQAAGVAWYLHFRTAEIRLHDEARVRAGQLGLKDENSDLFKAALKIAPPNS